MELVPPRISTMPVNILAGGVVLEVVVEATVELGEVGWESFISWGLAGSSVVRLHVNPRGKNTPRVKNYNNTPFIGECSWNIASPTPDPGCTELTYSHKFTIYDFTWWLPMPRTKNQA
jgi:hypothetical protein